MPCAKRIWNLTKHFTPFTLSPFCKTEKSFICINLNPHLWILCEKYCWHGLMVLEKLKCKIFTDSNELKGNIFILTINNNLHYTINSYLLVTSSNKCIHEKQYYLKLHSYFGKSLILHPASYSIFSKEKKNNKQNKKHHPKLLNAELINNMCLSFCTLCMDYKHLHVHVNLIILFLNQGI